MEQEKTKKTVKIFGLASFLNDMGSDMIYPIWPLFLTTVLGANMAILGFIDGLSDAIVSISKALSGYISDRVRKRKIFVWSGYLFGAVSRIGYAFSVVWQMVIPYRILDRVGKIRSAPRDAIVADITVAETRGKDFGFLKAMDNLGAVVGIIICIAFFEMLGYQRLFILAAIPSVIAAAMILLLIKEKKPDGDQLKIPPFMFRKINPNFRLFLLLSAIFSLGAFSYSFLLIYASKFGFKVYFIPVLYLILTFIASVFSIPFGRLADKIGRKPVLMISFVLWALVCLSFIKPMGEATIIAAFILYGLHKAALEPIQKTMVVELAPANYRASYLGTYQMVIGLCALPASLLAGELWDRVGMATPFYVSLGLTVIAVILLPFVKKPEHNV